jgi:Zn-dependent protease with chaperone function
VATDFFTHQEQARRNTIRLVVLFALAVLALIVSIDLLLGATMGYLGRDPRTGAVDWTLALDPALVALSVIGTLVVVGGGSLFKIAQLRGGGHVVAEELGGRQLHPDASDPIERKVLNVVEEMAIASGTPTPPVFLLDKEHGVNAFAAGFAPADAVVGITRGAAEHLTRDELQGVVAHEFSHILNGDMRLNIRLMGILHGILIIGMLGYFVLRMTAFSGYRGRRSKDSGGAAMAILALGAGLMVVGFCGTFFGNLIKAAVSRQREFLADASAVQFTRQPSGLAGALKKIGGLAEGSHIENANAPGASHMFFGRATMGFAGMFSTHPPLAERIRRIDPSWDGELPRVTAGPAASPEVAGVSSLAGGRAGRTDLAGVANAVNQIGQPSTAHISYAAHLLRHLPTALVNAAHEPYGARALVYALLLNEEERPRQAQLARLAAAADPGVLAETHKLLPVVAQLDVRARLPLVDISLPALRALTKIQYATFRQNVDALVRADQQIDLFEWSLHRVLLHDLEARRVTPGARRVRYHSVAAVQAPCELLLSTLAYAGARTLPDATQAFEQARLTLELPQARLYAADDCRLDALGDALGELDDAAPLVKRLVLRAAVASIAADDQVTASEAELLRAISASLGAPMPPLLPN